MLKLRFLGIEQLGNCSIGRLLINLISSVNEIIKMSWEILKEKGK
jgi:hypothetical protein